MSVSREEIAALLCAGDLTESEIARRLNVSRPTVGNVRKALGLPAPRQGHRPRYRTVEEAYNALTEPQADGHVRWTGHYNSHGTPSLRWGGRTGEVLTAYRIAFRLEHGREPVGIVSPVCGLPACVARGHVEDTPMRRAKQPPRRHRAPGAYRAEIVAMLKEGLSNRQIGQRLHVDPRRVAVLRTELGLPKGTRRPTISVEGKFALFTEPVGGGHLRWTGSLREGVTPVFMHGGTNLMARRVAFRLANGREPEGRVLAGCGWRECVAPAHVEDARMRAQYNAIFGEAAA